MLKIRDDIDLKELEKFGFEKIKMWGSECYIYDFIPYTSLNSSYLVIDIRRNRTITIAWVNFRQNEDKFLNLIFDLISSGLVEKVEDNNGQINT